MTNVINQEKLSYNSFAIEILACPKCGADLKKLDSSQNLCCVKCDEIIEYQDGIYWFDHEHPSFDANTTVKDFGQRWNTVYKSMGNLKNFLLESIQPVQKDFFKDKVILDGGGGFGRVTKLMLDFGAKHVILLDASDAVYAAVDYLEEYKDRVTIINANLISPPVKSDVLDVFMCHGVLHHTGAPEKVISHIKRTVKKDIGAAILWVYSKEGNGILSKAIAFSNSIASLIGNWGRWRLATLLDAGFWGLTHLAYKPLDFLFGIKSKLYYGEYFIDFLYDPKNSNRIDRLQMYHDFLTTQIIEYYSHEQLHKWFLEAGFKKLSLLFYRKQSWSIAVSCDPDEDFS